MDTKLSQDPVKIREKFLQLKTRGDVADLLEIPDQVLIYHIYRAPNDERFKKFSIPKKNGGIREICAPNSTIKLIQRKLADVLYLTYQPRPSVQGYSENKSVVTNANQHLKKRYVLNIDLNNFFPSINFGRVRGLFLSKPYEIGEEAATVLAQIACFENSLPQGAPCSPVIANMVCSRLDGQLQKLAGKHKCWYTRYADDITISSNLHRFPYALARMSPETNQLQVGNELLDLIKTNGFEINPSKSRLLTQSRRQDVTGVTTNEKSNVKRSYIRQIRAMIHALRKFGMAAAEQEFIKEYDSKPRYKKHFAQGSNPYLFVNVLKGKIEYLGMVRGKEDPIFCRFRSELSELVPGIYKDHIENIPGIATVSTQETRSKSVHKKTLTPKVYTEGKTDWMHIKAAYERLSIKKSINDVKVEFDEFTEERGNSTLLSMCKGAASLSLDRPHIFVFDHDQQKIVDDVTEHGKPFKYWGNMTYSLAIPIPSHRLGNPEICIEHYYQDIEIKTADKNGRRLFLSNEFDPKSGRHSNENLNTTLSSKLKSKHVFILDDLVFDVYKRNIALPKNDFAQNIYSRSEGFSNFDISAFIPFFEVLQSIIEHSRSQ